MTAFDDAVTKLYRAPFSDFVITRKQLADELKTRGERDSASRLAKLPRPPVSAWVVNQLWWKEQPTFEALIAAAARVKQGAREATKDHRALLGQLREAAADLLQAEGNAASESTLRRVTTTLSALAASGGFAPEPEGALSADRDPPGFEALGAFGMKAETPSAPDPPPAPKARPSADEERARAAAAEARRKEEEERARRKAERERLSKALAQARELREAQEREAAQLRRELAEKEHAVRETRSLVEELEAELASL